jgi:hypothetical protein
LDATFPTHQQYLGIVFFLIPNQLKITSFLGFVLSSCRITSLAGFGSRSQSIASRRMDVDDLQSFVTLYRDHCEVHIIIQRKTSDIIVIILCSRSFDVYDMISSICCLFCFVLFLRKGHAGRRHQFAVQHGGNDLAPTTTRPSTSIWKKILTKSCQSMLEGKIDSSCCWLKRRGGPDGRAANSLQHKNFFFFPFNFFVWFSLIFPQG